MANLTEPEDILAEFLHAEVTEVKIDSTSARLTNTSESFNGTGSKKDFQVSKTNMKCVNSVKVGGVTQTKNIHYYVDLDNYTVNFVTAPTSGTTNVVIDFDYGSGWIFPDKPRDDLSQSSFPRISIVKLEEPAVPLGAGSTEYWHEILFQIDCLAWKDTVATVSSDPMEGSKLARYIARQVVNAVKEQDLTKIANKLFEPIIQANHPVPFEEDKNIFRQVITLTMKAQNIGQ